MVDQRTKGLHFRLRARAMVIAERSNPKSRVAFVSTDICFGTQSIRLDVVPKLQQKYGDLYTLDNVVVSATHTHSGPGGYSWYAVYDMTTFGFDSQNHRAIADGVYQAIVRAHENMSSGGRIFMNAGRLLYSNINRSPTSYLQNPPEERKIYAEDGDTDKTIVVLRIEDDNGKELGSVSWFKKLYLYQW